MRTNLRNWKDLLRGKDAFPGGGAVAIAVSAICFVLAAAPGCDARGGAPGGDSARADDPSAAPVRVFVSILPQADFVKRIAGDRAQVDVLVGPGQSHHTYEPTPRQVTRLVESAAYFRIGVPFERALCDRIARAAPNLLMVDTSRGVSFLEMTGCCAAHDEPREEGKPSDAGHAHLTGRDPHIWLSPRLVAVQAQNIRDALARLDPNHVADYDRNLARFRADLMHLDIRIGERLAPFRGRPFFVFHPAYGYFADAYGLEQVAVEEDGKEPSARQLVKLVEQARSLDVRRIYVQPQFAVGGARAVADAIGAMVEPLDPMTTDYLRDLWTLAEKIAAGFEAMDRP
jgi:zinc transport system substrate-binding protein